MYISHPGISKTETLYLQDRDETEILNPQDQDETETFDFSKLSRRDRDVQPSRPRRDETFQTDVSVSHLGLKAVSRRFLERLVSVLKTERLGLVSVLKVDCLGLVSVL